MGDDYETEEEERKSKTVPYEPRISQPYPGWFGVGLYIWELGVLLWVFCMFLGFYNDSVTLISLLTVTIVIAAVGWLVNCLRCAPHYKTTPVTTYENGSRSEILVIRKPPNKAIKLQRDLQFHHDQSHFQSLIFSLLIVVLFLGIFLALKGTHNHQPIPTTSPTSLDIMNYITMKGFQLLTIGCFAWSFAHLMEGHSDFLFRHFTAVKKDNVDEREKDYVMNNKYNTKRRDVSFAGLYLP